MKLKDSHVSCQLLRSQPSSKLWQQISFQLNSQLSSQLKSQFWSQLRRQLLSHPLSQLDSQLDEQLKSKLRSPFGFRNIMFSDKNQCVQRDLLSHIRNYIIIRHQQEIELISVKIHNKMRDASII